ncbi:isoprenylcysteine carboxylmethyltransferase family protein, partial [bacterium]|nr:isoprenylcysteine carboxylmethyltransferase family protein [bacterium]
LFTPVLSFADYIMPPVVSWFGIILMPIALWLFWRSHADLGSNWSVTLEIRQGHELVTDGVYKYIRHPMYAAIWLFGLGQGLLLQNWLAGWSALLGFAIMYFIRTPQEEKMMCDFFGQAYLQYMQRTKRIFPLFNLGKQQ